MSELSKTIKALRKEKWKTQKEVAAAVNLTRTAYAAIESGRNEPKAKFILRLADYYRLSIDEIVYYNRLVS